MSKLVATVMIVEGSFDDTLKAVWSTSDDNQKNFMNPMWKGLEVRFFGEDVSKNETYLMVVGDSDCAHSLTELPCRVKEATTFQTFEELLEHEQKSEIGNVLKRNRMVICAYHDTFGTSASEFSERDVEYAKSRQVAMPAVLALNDITAKVSVSESCDYESNLHSLTAMNYPHENHKRHFTVTVKLFKDGEPIYLAFPKKVGVDILYDEDSRQVVYVEYTEYLKNSKITITSSGSLPYLRSCIRDIVNYLNAFPEDQCSLQTENKGLAVKFNLMKLI